MSSKSAYRNPHEVPLIVTVYTNPNQGADVCDGYFQEKGQVSRRGQMAGDTRRRLCGTTKQRAVDMAGLGTDQWLACID